MRTLDNSDLQKINTVLRTQDWLKVISEVTVLKGGNGSGVGYFEVATSKATLRIRIAISPNFPRQGCVFFCDEVIGLKHVMQDGSICLKASPAVDLEDRLLLELEKLHNWVERYYIGDHQDAHFEYLSYVFTEPMTVIFEEDITKPAVEREYGSFTYLDTHSVGNADLSVLSVIALNMGNRKCRWSSFYQRSGQQPFAGLWLMLDQPPVLTGRKTIIEWNDLLKLLSPDQKRALQRALREYPPLSITDKGILIGIGYLIPGEKGEEVHWDFIVTEGNFKTPIHWLSSVNASYNRVFGRGALDSAITNEPVLIIGTGAIGSSLFMSLVRGGCRNIAISDGDLIEPGNICRGDFSFIETRSNKAIALLQEGRKISPHVELRALNRIEPLLRDDTEYPNVHIALSQFRYIFDCSTDKYLSLMLDEMQLPGAVINLSISYGAKQMTVITGTGNIHTLKSDLYDRLSPGERPPFYVATGCWSPTFEASWSEINVLLQYALTEINQQVKKKLPVRSFYFERLENVSGSLEYKLNYHV